jgi:putative ABC transport system permease protein
MFRHHLLSLWRSVRKHRTFSLINLLGLAGGMGACLLILQYVYFESSFDDFHDNKNDIYRLAYRNQARDVETSLLRPGLADLLQASVPEVEAATRLWRQEATVVVENGGQQESYKEAFVYADEAFFKIFSFPMLHGTAENALADPSSIVITESLAQKYFGEASAELIGKRLRLYHLDETMDFQVSAIARDLPPNSHINQQLFVQIDRILDSERARQWSMAYWSAFPTYLQLEKNADLHAVIDKINAEIGSRVEDFKDSEMVAEALPSIYQDSPLENTLGSSGQGQYIFALLLIAIFIMAIAWINYVNLTTAQATERAREVGIRKVAGSSRAYLIRQFLLEVLAMNIFSAILALTIFQLALPHLADLLEKELQAVSLLAQPLFWPGLLLTLLVGSLLSGIYPSLVLSRYQPIQVLKGKFSNSREGIVLRKSLIVLQFAASFALVCGTYVVFEQLNFMRSQELGADISQTLVVEGPGVRPENGSDLFEQMRHRLEGFSFVEHTILSGNVPGTAYNYWTQAAQPEEDLQQARSFAVMLGDEHYLPGFDIPLLAGRYFNPKLSHEKQKLILNETAVKYLGFTNNESAIGQEIRTGDADQPKEIIGVVADYHHTSLQHAYDPILFSYDNNSRYISLKINIGSTHAYPEVLAEIEETFAAFFPQSPFLYFFLDEQFDSLYQEDQRFGRLFAIFAGLAVFVALLGLFGLTAYSVSQKTKEIGIRKILGASVPGLLHLLTRDLALLMLLAVVAALPLTYWAMNQWLSNYAFSIDYSVMIYVLPVLLVLLMGLLTVLLQTLKAARTNPVDSLRYE